MSEHYSKFDLNTYRETPYFRAHVPPNYPVGPVLVKCRAFRRLPPNLRKLAELAKQWSVRNVGNLGIDQWYDDDGYELDPSTKKRLTDKEIDAQWDRGPNNDSGSDDIEVKDIPIPAGGFADPDKWEEPEEDDSDPDDVGITEQRLVQDIQSHGREYVAREYGVPVKHSDAMLARSILQEVARRRGGEEA